MTYKHKTLILLLLWGVSRAFCVQPGDTIILKKTISHPGGDWKLTPAVFTVYQMTERGDVIVRATERDGGTRDYVISSSAYTPTVKDYQGIKPNVSSVFLKVKIKRGFDDWWTNPGVTSIQFVGADGTLVHRIECSDKQTREFVFPRGSYQKLIEEYKGIKPGDSVLLKTRAHSVTDKWYVPPGARVIQRIRSDGALIIVSNGSDDVTRNFVLPPKSYVKLVDEYKGIKVGDAVLLLERAKRTEDIWYANPDIKAFQYIAADGTLIHRSKDSDGLTRDYFYYPQTPGHFFTKGKYVPLVQEYLGVKPKSEVFLSKKIKSIDGTGTLSPGVKVIDAVGANGVLYAMLISDEGELRGFLIPPNSYTKLKVLKDEKVERTPVTPALESTPSIELSPSEQRYYVEQKKGFFSEKKEFPVVMIKKDGTEAYVVNAHHFKDALSLRNSLDIYRIPLTELKVASTPEVYSEMFRSSSGRENTFPGSFVDRARLDATYIQNRSSDPVQATAQLYAHLAGSLCPTTLKRLAE